MLCLVQSAGLPPQDSRSGLQTWDREVAPGLLFRMERQANPQLNVYGVRLTPAKFQMRSKLAKRAVYDLSSANGRDILANMVAEDGALGGVNGDFFQWGADPGGDPVNLMLSGGELLSHPTGAAKGFAVAWGDKTRLSIGSGEWTAKLRILGRSGSEPVAINSLNARVDADQKTLHTDTAGFFYASVPAKYVRVWIGAYRLSTRSRLTAEVTETGQMVGAERIRISPGEAIITASGKETESLAKAIPGTKLEIDVTATGFDFAKSHEAMGGGPVLLRSGKIAVARPKDTANDPRHPRTLIGETAAGDRWLIVVDGRQSMSVGATLYECAEIMRRWECVEALNLDGGGSTSLNLLGITMNRPSGGIERLIANGVLFNGQLPKFTGRELKVLAADSIKVGDKVTLSITRDGKPVPSNEAIFSAQGGGWVTQDGVLTATQAGQIKITVWSQGSRATVNVACVP